MSFIIYSDNCIPCKFKKDYRVVLDFAHKNNIHVVDRRVVIKPEWREEAISRSDIDMPYIYNEDTKASVRLKDVTIEQLNNLL